MRTIALINQKGGVGKTTSAVNISYGLMREGKRVLLVDLDPQANATSHVGIKTEELKHTVYDLLKGVKATAVWVVKDGVTIIPSSLDLSGAEFELSGITGRELLLRESFSTLTDFDYVIIDCPPSLGLLTVNAMTAVKEIFVVVQTEFLALQGVAKLIEAVSVVKKRLNRSLEVTGIIGTMFDQRRKLNKEVITTITKHFGNKLFTTMIRDNVALAEAPSHGLSIFDYQLSSFGARDYRDLSEEIVAMEGKE